MEINNLNNNTNMNTESNSTFQSATQIGNVSKDISGMWNKLVTRFKRLDGQQQILAVSSIALGLLFILIIFVAAFGGVGKQATLYRPFLGNKFTFDYPEKFVITDVSKDFNEAKFNSEPTSETLRVRQIRVDGKDKRSVEEFTNAYLNNLYEKSETSYAVELDKGDIDGFPITFTELVFDDMNIQLLDVRYRDRVIRFELKYNTEEPKTDIFELARSLNLLKFD
jgi:hypothetical protein